MRNRGDLTSEQWERIEPLLPKTTTKRGRPAHEHRQLLNGILWVRRVNGTLSFLLTDHLGSTSLTTNASGGLISELRYTAWGQVRYASGTTPTHYTFTGQYSNMTDFGLMFYNARWPRSVPETQRRGYDPVLGRFAQADSLVPPGMQGSDRYAYVNNDPVRYTDPSGHSVDCGLGDLFCSAGKYTPGGIINLYRYYFGDDAVERRDSKHREKMSAEIEDYMNSHSGYNPLKDAYMGDPRKPGDAYKNYTVFRQVREDYWTHRYVEETGTWDPGEIGHLMDYYDFHQDIAITEWSATGVDWVGTGLDSASFVAAVVALVVAPEYAVYANATSAGFGVFSGGRSVLNGDYVGGGLSAGGFAKPPFGTLLSGVSVICDISADYYDITYIPPFER